MHLTDNIFQHICQGNITENFHISPNGYQIFFLSQVAGFFSGELYTWCSRFIVALGKLLRFARRRERGCRYFLNKDFYTSFIQKIGAVDKIVATSILS